LNKKIIENLDKNNMFSVIKDLYKHVEHSFEIIKESSLHKVDRFKNIVICGMGGSAIGGDFVKTVLFNELTIPIYVNRDYNLPNWTDSKSLVIICSYSGNTEESISCLKQSIDLDINPIIISSGGYILNKAIQNNYSYVQLPPSIQPRAAFGYSASLLLLTLNKLNLIKDELKEGLFDSINILKNMSEELSDICDDNRAIMFSSEIYNKYPIIYGTPLTDIVSLRFRCQLAENTKILSSHFMIPEQNHNEIEGFLNANMENLAIIWIYDIDDHPRNIKRVKLTSSILEEVKDQYRFCESGENLVIRLFKLIYFFDWVSFYGAMHNNINPTPVNTILQLKSLMSK
jgi:glucose/mannose-6-phosphate isomerase